MNTPISLNTLAGIKSTACIDGEFVKAKKFIAETDSAEIYATKDCLVTYRDDLAIDDLVMEVIDITAEDKVIKTLYIESSNGIVVVQVVAPALNPNYRYYRAVKPLQAEVLLDAITQKAIESNLDPKNVTQVMNFEDIYFGKGCKGKFATFFSENNACQNLLQVKSTILIFIKNATNVV